MGVGGGRGNWTFYEFVTRIKFCFYQDLSPCITGRDTPEKNRFHSGIIYFLFDLYHSDDPYRYVAPPHCISNLPSVFDRNLQG